MNSTEQPLFGPEDVISTYTDREAVEDGVLVAVSSRDRVTRTVWEWLVEKQPQDSRPPNCWPVGLMAWFTAGNIKKVDALKMIAEHGKDEAQKKFKRMVADNKALAMAVGLITREERKARQVYNIGGGIHKVFTLESERGIDTLEITDPGERSGKKVLWLIPNECGGITLMFPEDY